MLVLEIALGIVLAVLILGYLPELLALGAMAVAIGLVVLVGGLALLWVFWVFTDPGFFALVLVVAVVFAVGLLVRWDLSRGIDEGERRRKLGYTDSPVAGKDADTK